MLCYRLSSFFDWRKIPFRHNVIKIKGQKSQIQSILIWPFSRRCSSLCANVLYNSNLFAVWHGCFVTAFCFVEKESEYSCNTCKMRCGFYFYADVIQFVSLTKWNGILMNKVNFVFFCIKVFLILLISISFAIWTFNRFINIVRIIVFHLSVFRGAFVSLPNLMLFWWLFIHAKWIMFSCINYKLL